MVILLYHQTSTDSLNLIYLALRHEADPFYLHDRELKGFYRYEKLRVYLMNSHQG